MIKDLLSAGALMKARLTDQIQGLHAVKDSDELAGLNESTLGSPTAFVIFDRQTAAQERADGMATQIEQQWLVVLAVRYAAGDQRNRGVRDAAGPYLLAICQALLGWKPSEDHTPLKLAAPPAADYTVAFGYFPLAFTTRITIYGKE